MDVNSQLPIELDRQTAEEAASVLGADTIVLLPIGSCEPHGPHLTLGSDVPIARAWCKQTAVALRESGARAVVMPALPYGLSHLTEGFAGRVTLQPGTLWALLEDLVCSLEQEGVRRVVFASTHLEAQHLRVLEGVALDHTGGTAAEARVVVLDSSGVLPQGVLPALCHAGAEETSLLLAARAAAVKLDCARVLEPLSPDQEKIEDGYLAAGASRAYCGNPASATAEEGARLLAGLTRKTVETLSGVWPDLNP
ncbi:MAG TPA: creatininase family protein [Planctomycetota bacterium]|nr:creatininase family protein [Planctomycetota bacterium]